MIVHVHEHMLRTLDMQCTQRPLIFGQKTSFIVYYGYFSYCLPSLKGSTYMYNVCIMCLIKDECKYAHIVTCYQFLFARIRNTETNKRIKQQNLPSVEICMRFVTKSLTNLLGSFSAQWMVRCASIYDPDPGSHKFLSYFCSVVLLFCCVFVSLQSLLIFFSCATHPKAPFKSYIGQL